MSSISGTIPTSNIEIIFRIGFDILDRLGIKSTMISPVGIMSCMAILQSGANGNVLSDLMSFTGFSDPISGVNSLMNLNCHSFKMFNFFASGDTPAKESFIENVKRIAEITDGINVSRLNAKIASVTNGLIPEALDPEDKHSSYVVGSVNHFKDNWKTQFDPTLTTKQTFHGRMGERLVDMMRANDVEMSYYESDSVKSIAIPYISGEFDFVLCMTTKGTSLPERFEVLECMEHLTDTENVAILEIPKFTLGMKHDLKPILSEIGLGSIMIQSDDFSGISDDPMYVSKVTQDVRLDVNEEGTEASSVTVACMSKGLSIRKYIIADRPFTFLVVHRATMIPVFIGNYV
jgi:serine protease inhibitor